MLLRNLIVLICVLLLDQGSKAWAEKVLQLQAEPIPFFNNLFELHYSRNTGMAFSFLDDRPGFMLVLVLTIILAIVYLCIQEKRLDLSLAFILAGGLGNLMDRLIYGYVVDFINPLFINFAIFNIADISLNIGVALLILTALTKRKSAKG